MDATFITTVYVVCDTLQHSVLEPVKYKPKMSPAEVITVAIVAARHFGNNLECALLVMAETGYIPKHRALSVSRFNRQLHKQADFLAFCLQTLMELSIEGDAFIIDSIPAPVCKRVRARRCRKVRGAIYCGYCAAKKEKFFGFRLHLICSPEGLPCAFTMLPAALHDLTPIYELTVDLPDGACVYGDKAFNSGDDEAVLALDGLRLIPVRRKNMTPNHWVDDMNLAYYRHGIETANSQLESMGIQRLRARTNTGFEIKVHCSLMALYHTQAIAMEN